MSVLRGLYTGLMQRGLDQQASPGLGGHSAGTAREKRAGNFSCGRAHSALVRIGLAKRQVASAASLQQVANSENQDVARIAFSVLSRGRNSSVSRAVQLAYAKVNVP